MLFLLFVQFLCLALDIIFLHISSLALRVVVLVLRGLLVPVLLVGGGPLVALDILAVPGPRLLAPAAIILHGPIVFLLPLVLQGLLQVFFHVPQGRWIQLRNGHGMVQGPVHRGERDIADVSEVLFERCLSFWLGLAEVVLGPVDSREAVLTLVIVVRRHIHDLNGVNHFLVCVVQEHNVFDGLITFCCFIDLRLKKGSFFPDRVRLRLIDDQEPHARRLRLELRPREAALFRRVLGYREDVCIHPQEQVAQAQILLPGLEELFGHECEKDARPSVALRVHGHEHNALAPDVGDGD
mmetsp:Transcript_49486/g.139671  ORF Transcript_49486/g.139671 Transcript_49486/m.139671 type:complete len:296 (-) Transcript_49486:806-1693(-)